MGRIPSVETRAKLSVAEMGRVQSPETKAKISAARMGQKPSPESTAKMAAGHWKGGSAMVGERHHAKRRTLGYVSLNEPFVGCEGHHVDNERVINMPKKLHRSVYHRQSDGRGMEMINAVAYNFLFNQGVEAALKEA